MPVAAANSETLSGSHWTHIARLVPSFGAAQVLQAITSFLIARFLLPSEYGLWSLFAVLLFYCAQLHLGSINLMHKEVPFFLTAKDGEAAEQVTNFAFSLSTTNCVLAALVISAAGLFWQPKGVSLPQIILLALLVVSQELFIFVNYWLRAYRRFSGLSRYLSLYACCNLVLVASLAWWKHLTGVLLGYVLTGGCVAAYFVLRQNIHLGYRLVGPCWKNLGNAFQLLLWTMMFVFLTTVDRVFISWRMGMFALGLFGVSLLVSSMVYNTADAVLQVVFPAASALAAGSQSAGEITTLLLRTSRTLSYGLAAVLGLGFLLLPALVPVILPRYAAGIPAARIVCLGLAPLVLGHLLSVGLVVMGRVTQCLLLQGAVLAAKLMLLLTLHHPQLTEVAVISGLANVLYLLAMLAIMAPASVWVRLRSLSSILAPWLLVAMILLVVSLPESNTGGSGVGVLLPSILYLLFSVPSLWLVHRFTRGALSV
ncbi:MAG: lipopolysaccharide biosynthesis protein [Acidobacteriota bacterium]